VDVVVVVVVAAAVTAVVVRQLHPDCFFLSRPAAMHLASSHR
jgi:hypothetical protein